ncbi:MAG: hypothetical protein P9X22_09135 [Candidatus Zapsychrus exili]|nr:hypothetical protein [Candidatus Zapsychrus exili]
MIEDMPTRIFLSYKKVFKRHPFFTTIVFIVYLVIVFSFSIRAISEHEDKNQLIKAKEEFVAALHGIPDKEIGQDSLERKIKIIFNSANRHCNNILEEYGYINTLEDCIKSEYLSSSPNVERISMIFSIIESEKKVDPYFGLQNEQRIALKNLEIAIKSNNQELIKENFEEIREFVKSKNRELNDLANKNRWNLPVGLIGLILTILFGLLSLLITVWKKDRNKLQTGIVGGTAE